MKPPKSAETVPNCQNPARSGPRGSLPPSSVVFLVACTAQGGAEQRRQTTSSVRMNWATRSGKSVKARARPSVAWRSSRTWTAHLCFASKRATRAATSTWSGSRRGAYPGHWPRSLCNRLHSFQTPPCAEALASRCGLPSGQLRRPQFFAPIRTPAAQRRSFAPAAPLSERDRSQVDQVSFRAGVSALPSDRAREGSCRRARPAGSRSPGLRRDRETVQVWRGLRARLPWSRATSCGSRPASTAICRKAGMYCSGSPAVALGYHPSP